MFKIKLTSLFLLGFITFNVTAADIQVYFNHPVNAPAVQSDLEKKIIEVINSSTTTLHMAVYDLDLPGIANAMVAAKNRGVDVRFITDHDNIAGENQTAIDILNSGGVPWIDDTENGSAGSKIMHDKFIIVDGKEVLTGSTNFTQSGIHGDLDANGNVVNQGNDNHIVMVQSNQLATVYEQQFEIMWGDGPGGLKDSLFGLGKPDHQLETVYTTNDHIQLDVQFSPQSPTVYAGSTLDSIQHFIQIATVRIHMAQFVISAQDIADEMQRSQSRGVEIEGIGDPGFFSRYYSEFLDMEGQEKLNTAGTYEVDSYTGAPNNPWSTPADVRMAHLDYGDKFHHKYIIIDNMVLTGSHNISGSAAFGNDENILVIHDKKIADEFEGHFSMAYCLAGNGSNCQTTSYAAGTWEGVSFTSSEVATIIDIVNNASMTQLDIDAALDKRAAQNIINDRVITSMDQLAAVAYVGPSAMQKLKDYIASW